MFDYVDWVAVQSDRELLVLYRKYRGAMMNPDQYPAETQAVANAIWYETKRRGLK